MEGNNLPVKANKYTVKVGDYPHTKLVEILKDKNKILRRPLIWESEDSENKQDFKSLYLPLVKYTDVLCIERMLWIRVKILSVPGIWNRLDS